jgi:hypothetical protein
VGALLLEAEKLAGDASPRLSPTSDENGRFAGQHDERSPEMMTDDAKFALGF